MSEASLIKKENYITVQGFMVTDLKLKGNELLIYAIIHGFSQTNNQWFNGSRRYLAEWTNSTKQGVQNCLNSLVQKGLIEKQEEYLNGIKFCRYRTTYFGGGQQSLPPSQQSLLGWSTNLTGGGQQSLPNNIDNKIAINGYNNEPTPPKPSKLSVDRFNDFWNAYPKQIHRTLAEQAYVKSLIGGSTEEWLIDAAKEYALCIQGTESRFVKNPENWLQDNCYLDYPPGTYEKRCKEIEKQNKSKEAQKPKGTKFNNFPQRDYDYDDLEAKLLQGL